MKPVYFRFFSVTILTLFLLSTTCFRSSAQCANGHPSGVTAYDTTIAFSSGIVATDVKFPKFDPQSGMVTCVRLCVTIRGIIDTVALENFTNAPQTGSYTYTRKDTIRGPGIPTFLQSNANLSFGSFPLDATNGVFGSGPDFYSNGSDTVLTRVLCANISDSTTISQFYGLDSVTYNYRIDADAVGMVTGGSSLAFVLSSAQVNFHFEYCTCPPVVLPLNIRQFNVTRLEGDRVELKWNGYDDPYINYYYEAEVSRNGYSFSPIGSLQKKSGTEPYRIEYRAGENGGGSYFFRIRQVYAGGNSRYSNIRQIEMENSDFPRFSIYPNPSSGIVGIKFDKLYSGRFNIQIYNTQGQVIVRKEIVTNGSSYERLATLESGVYWLRITDAENRKSSVSQLLIK